ncbi:filamentous hemagglutinin N-terminal domain-containing protein [Myxosarcina sp. GI1]|uniref:two-partner secretion domain-containing protein n=1 Tax=Myxosarcina sp. GI1 TaxID=1541065 RepID=UPI00155A6D6D|nr:filamentous hemagglutinin N-terminal domain-containing protein [Myxosarcina sp. GI1]
MKKLINYFFICLSLTIPSSVVAQIVPDTSLNTESSTIDSINELRQRIEGGAIRGENLFHSFQEFNVGEGLEVYFANPAGIENIFSRITGSNVSKIFGTLGVEGTANLFLMNPNGIVFGQNAAIDVGGSFIATTAESIKFKDGIGFSATKPLAKPVLTVEIPVGLGFGTNSSPIQVKGSGHSIVDTFTFLPYQNILSSDGLKVKPKQTIALLGGDIILDGGNITAESGQIELASVANGEVKLNKNNTSWNFNYENINSFGDIQITNRSSVNTSGFGDGKISFHGDEIEVSFGSIVMNQNQGSKPSQAISVNSRKLDINGVSENGDFRTSFGSIAAARGKSSTIKINTEEFFLRNGATLGTATYGIADGGNVVINAIVSVNLYGAWLSPLAPTASFLTAQSKGQGNAGNISIATKTMNVSFGAAVGSLALGSGNSGNLTINATDSISIVGDTDPNALMNNSDVFVATTASGNAGFLQIDTARLRIVDGGRINAASLSSGSSGKVVIDAVESIELIGGSTDFNITGQISSSASRAEGFSRTLAILESLESPTGNAGGVEINTPKLSVSDNGEINVRNGGIGDAGSLQINSDLVSFDNSTVAASTISGDGGNINLNTDRLSLSNNSQISATAGGVGDSGNIDITADTILGFNNSDITANAFEGSGGNIEITTDTIIGLEARPSLTPDNDITADSELGIDGTVTINSPESNAEEDVIVSARELNLESYRELLKGSCLDPNRPERSELVYLGGGVPESPYNFFDDEDPIVTADEVPSEPKPNSKPSNRQTNNNVPPIWQEGDPLIEPNAVQTNADGRTFLVAVQEREISQPQVCTREAADLK